MGSSPRNESRPRKNADDGAGDRQHQPVLRDLLHPGADGRGERAEPENAEIAVGERRSDAAERRSTRAADLVLRRRDGRQMFADFTCLIWRTYFAIFSPTGEHMANHALAVLETALRERKLDRTLTTALPPLERSDPRRSSRSISLPWTPCLRGGLPRGQVSELAGPHSSGRTTLLLQLLGAATCDEARRRDRGACRHMRSPRCGAARLRPASISIALLWIRGERFELARRSIASSIARSKRSTWCCRRAGSAWSPRSG